MLKRLSLKIASWVHILIYRTTGGAIGNSVASIPVLLLTTAGRKTGKRRIVPLGYMEEGENYVLIGSNGGQDRHPDWIFNLRSDPRATIQVKKARLVVEAQIADSEETTRLWAELTQRAPIYLRYRGQTEREIPTLFMRPQS